MKQPRHPIYVISKGRWESMLTVKALKRAKVTQWRIAVEPQEAGQYEAALQHLGESPSRLLVTPFSNLGQGSIPVRNWCWEHAIAEGHERHWMVDDNIRYFFRLHQNTKLHVRSPVPFNVVENFTDRYENVALSGMQYGMFASQRQAMAPMILNTRVYSCILIDNALDFRWRGRYNEDTDLSIRALKSGYCTVLINAFLCAKSATMTVRGGNTEELYAGDGRLKMAQSLQRQHPDIVTIYWRWGRWQHKVDYSQFKLNKLRPKPGVKAVGYTSDKRWGIAKAKRKGVRNRVSSRRIEDAPRRTLRLAGLLEE